jgi:hypothetical protein
MRKRIDLARVLRLTPNTEQKRLLTLAMLVQNTWKKTAASHLNASSQSIRDYKNAITIDPPELGKGGALTIKIVLRSSPAAPMPNILEKGLGAGGIGTSGPIDLRSWFLKGGADQRIIHFPNTKTSIRQHLKNVGVTGSRKKQIIEQLQKLLPGTTVITKMGQAMIRNTQLGQAFPEGKVPKMKVSHETDILARMYRMTTDRVISRGPRKGQKYQESTYSLFRTITREGAGNTWIHPGVDARNIADLVRVQIPRLIREMNKA